MKGPYTANSDKTISYKGNNLFRPILNIALQKFPTLEIENRVSDLKKNYIWEYIAKINHTINMSSNIFFDEHAALFTTLPLTTRMISSPGAVYGKEALDYTSDTCPITINWFNISNKAFLSESSQIYLELALMQKNIKGVYSIYNSFRKEEADATHLSEFHHIEYEGKISQEDNETMSLNLIGRIINDLISKNEKELAYFLNSKKLIELDTFAQKIGLIPKISFKEALEALYFETKEEKYLRFSLQNFGSWEEVKLTEIFDNMIMIKQFPLLEVPFYHAVVKNSNPKVADNADIIWPGYREILGSGKRIGELSELEEKAKIFNLPADDYKPYLQSREYTDYEGTSGFGLGWERLLQGLLQMPYIWDVCQFPRGHTTLKP